MQNLERYKEQVENVFMGKNDLNVLSMPRRLLCVLRCDDPREDIIPNVSVFGGWESQVDSASSLKMDA